MKALEYREFGYKKNLLFKIHEVNPLIIIIIERGQLQGNSFWNLPIWRCSPKENMVQYIPNVFGMLRTALDF